MWGSIPRLWHHDLSQRQTLNQLSHPGTPTSFSFLFFFFFFKKILFIFLTEIETASERGNTSRGSGEEEAGSQQRSLMWGSIPRLWDHALCRRQTLKCCATQVPPSLCLLILMSVLDTGCTAHMQNV